MIKKIATITFATLLSAHAAAQTSVGVSVGIYEPGVHGRIDLGT
jgi:hypothetical protein